MPVEFASSKSSPELAFGGLEGAVARRLASASPQALLSALLWGDIQNQEKIVGPKWKWLGVIQLNCQYVFLNTEKCQKQSVLCTLKVHKYIYGCINIHEYTYILFCCLPISSKIDFECIRSRNQFHLVLVDPH